MTSWRPQPFRTKSLALGRNSATVEHAIATAERLADVTPSAVPIFTLRHLSHLTGAPYVSLRAVVSRAEPDPYRISRFTSASCRTKLCGSARLSFRTDH